VEKVFIVASFFYVTYLLAGFLARPAGATLCARLPCLRSEEMLRAPGYLYLVVALVGTTIAPWMQFYLQASIVEKGVTKRSYQPRGSTSSWAASLRSWWSGSSWWPARRPLYIHGHHDVRDARGRRPSSRPLAGDYAYILFALGLLNASLFAASICHSRPPTRLRGFGFESGLDRKFGEAPLFYWLYTLLIAAGAGVILIPNFPW